MISHDDLRQFIYETGSPFKRLEALLSGVTHNPDLEPITMTVGEPRHAPPEGLIAAMQEAQRTHATSFGKYPAINGSPEHRRAITEWATKRYGLKAEAINASTNVLPLNGSREGLVFAAQTARDLRQSTNEPVILMQNPFYQAYAAAAHMAGCSVVLLDEDDLTGDQIEPELWPRVCAAYIASPTNPQGVVLTHSQWDAWIEKARIHGFYLFADECYSEIYRRTPPPGVLEVAANSAGGLRNIVSFNSLSKRSNLPGLRTGFAIGDETFMAAFMRLRNMGGPQVPLPLQAVATQAWQDEAHVIASRALYAKKWEMVDKLLGDHLTEPTPQAGFFLWLSLPQDLSDTEAAIRLWQDQSLRTIPGSFIAYPSPPSTGADRLRLALVDDEPTTHEALTRLATLFA